MPVRCYGLHKYFLTANVIYYKILCQDCHIMYAEELYFRRRIALI
jgi:hypothetical protein